MTIHHSNNFIIQGFDTVIVDTAGRQVVDAALMKELQEIKAAITPDETLLVVDAMTGQEAGTPNWHRPCRGAVSGLF